MNFSSSSSPGNDPIPFSGEGKEVALKGGEVGESEEEEEEEEVGSGRVVEAKVGEELALALMLSVG